MMTIRNSSIAALAITMVMMFAGNAHVSAAEETAGANNGARMTLNFVETDIREVAGSIGQITGKNFILDPRVKGRVTVVSSSPISTDAVYETFLSVLQVNNFAAVPAGDNMVKIIPSVDARSVAGNDLPSRLDGPVDDMVTQVIQIENVNAAQLVPILRPLVPQTGHLAAYPGSNMLIISDRAGNVQRLMRIIRRIDQTSDEDVEVISLEHASASETVRVVSQLTRDNAESGSRPPTLVADDRTNSVLISGDRSDRLRLRALISHLDTPLESGGDTQVIYLRYANAENLASILQSQVSEAQSGAQRGGGEGAAARSGSAYEDAVILHEPDTNALVITAAPKLMRTIKMIIEKLDIRRAQVHVEAIIAEISSDKAAELGVQWAVEGTGSNSPVAMSNFPQSDGTGIGQIGAGLLGDDASGLGSLANAGGLTLGFGRIVSGSTSFVGLLRALTGNSSTNILSTPSITTMDNEEAEIKVGQEVPFVTGQFTNTGGSGTGAVNPFQTIQREEVGLSLKVKPQISDSDTIAMLIEQEVSSLSQGVQGAADLITNKRTITTNVLAENGEIIVLGGLIDDQVRESEQRVPVLGAIPLLGELFRYRSSEKIKRNLMVFMKPSIMRTADDAALYTNEKYRYLRDIQRAKRDDGESVQLMYGEEQPLLPETGKSADLVPRTDSATDDND